MAAAAASPALKRLDLRDPAALFESHGAEEIRGLERQVRAEIEHKKEELRQMVGERYRDLIEAADTIGQMRRCAEGLVGAVKATDQYCSRLRQAGSAAPRPPRDPQVSPGPPPPARPLPPPRVGRRPWLGLTCLRKSSRHPLRSAPGGTPAVLPLLLTRSPRSLGRLLGGLPALPGLAPLTSPVGSPGLSSHLRWRRQGSLARLFNLFPVSRLLTLLLEQSSPVLTPSPQVVPSSQSSSQPRPHPIPKNNSHGPKELCSPLWESLEASNQPIQLSSFNSVTFSF